MAENTLYTCRYMTRNGVIEVKEISAENKAGVESALRSSGATPIEITEKSGKASKTASSSFLQQKVKAKDISIYCRQQQTMLHAGMPLIKTLEVMNEQLDHQTLKEATGHMMDGVRKGNMYSDVLKKHPKVFPELFVSMIETGEMTGRQDEVLAKMAIHYQKEDVIEKKIKGAMIYPIFLSILTVAVVIIMLVKILPKFVKMFEGTDVEMPAVTQFVMDTSDFVIANWYFLLAGIILIVLGFKFFVKTPGGRRAYDGMLLKLPIVGTSIRKVVTSRFTRTLSTLLGSGLPLLQSLQMAGKVTRNVVVEESINKLTDDIKKGSKLSVLIRQMSVFPPMLVSMISVGEESGSLEEMLEKTADFYDYELESAMDSLVGLIEPVMILVMGLIIGFIVVAMLLPIFEIIKTVQ